MNISQQTHNRHRRHLKTIQSYLQAVGLGSLIMEPSDLLPIHALVVSFRASENASEYLINLTFIPIEDQEEDLNQISLLQFYALFRSDIEPEARDTLNDFLLAINAKLPVGHVSIKSDDDVFFRYVHTLPRHLPIHEASITQLTLLFVGVFLSLTELVNAAATGEIDLDTAIEAISIF